MSDLIKNREYNKLFFGSNQEDGYDKPFLGFESDVFLEIFKTDRVTYFHYPIICPVLPLSSAGLIESGAIAGPIPHYADKIWKKQANYKKYIHWGDSQQRQIGVWLCSWLSGNPMNPEAKPVWKDRWYNPGYYDPITASFVYYSPYIIDVDSEMTLDPGVWYKYYHFGNKANKEIVDSLSGHDGRLVLYFENWNEKELFHEKISYDIFSNERNDDIVLKLNSKNKAYTQVLYHSSNELKEDFTLSFWVNVKDWNNPNSNYIISREFRGGWSFLIDSGFVNPIFSVISNNNIIFGNLNDKIYFSKNFLLSSQPYKIVLDQNLYFYVIDNGNYMSSKNIYKIDYNGDIVYNKKISNNSFLKDIKIDQDNKIYVLDINNKSISTFNSNLDYLSSVNYSFFVKSFTLDVSSNIVTSEKDLVFLDLSSKKWEFDNDKIYYNNILFLSSSKLKTFNLDKNDNIYILNDTYLIKYTNFIPVLSTNVEIPIDDINNICFFDKYQNNKIEHFMYLTSNKNRKIYIYNTQNLNLENIIDLSKFQNNPISIDNGYEWNKKYKYYLNNKDTKILFNMWTIDSQTKEIKKHTLSFSTSSLLNEDWYLFTVIFNPQKQKIQFYLDNNLMSEKIISKYSKVYYEYESPIVFGTQLGQTMPLPIEINSNDYLDCKIDSFRFYDYAIDPIFTFYLFLDKYNYNDLKWNFKTKNLSYIEEINQFFRYSYKGSKSQFYNIILKGLNILNDDIKRIIEKVIRDTVKKITPVHTYLYKIIWK